MLMKATFCLFQDPGSTVLLISNHMSGIRGKTGCVRKLLKICGIPLFVKQLTATVESRDMSSCHGPAHPDTSRVHPSMRVGTLFLPGLY